MGIKERILEPYDEKKGGILLSILLILVAIPALGYGRGWAFAGALRWIDRQVLELTGSGMADSGMWTILKSNAIVAWFLLFFVLGSFVAAKLSDEFGYKFDRASVSDGVIGGFLMGVGIVFITTCNIGIFLNSLPMLTVGAYLAGIGLVIGTYIGAKIFERRMGL